MPTYRTLEGRRYAVSPVVLLTVGVHAGSAGAILYTNEELEKSVQGWNYKPILRHHAMDSYGSYTSANDAGVIERQKIGFLLNTRMQRHKLVSEGWIDCKRCEQIAPDIWRAILADRVVEVSTGLFSKNEDVPHGVFNGRSYAVVARDYRPDHLAILPDQIGACSVAVGCGLNRNQASNGLPISWLEPAMV